MPRLAEEDEEAKLAGRPDPAEAARCSQAPAPAPESPALPPAPLFLSAEQTKRRHIVASLVHSENNYVASLQRLVRDYRVPLEEASPPILSQAKVDTLFHKLGDILACHHQFRVALTEAVLSWDKVSNLEYINLTILLSYLRYILHSSKYDTSERNINTKQCTLLQNSMLDLISLSLRTSEVFKS